DDLQFKSEKLDELAVGEELDSLSLKEEDKEIRNKNIAKGGSLFNQLDVRFDNLSTEVELEVADVAEQVDFRENIESINDKIIEFMDLNRDENSVRLKLHPEELGYVDLNLKMEEGKLVVKILVENEAARDLFNSNLNQLNNNLLRQDIVLGRVDIELSLNSNNPSANSNSRNQGNRPYRTSRIQFSKESPAVTYINDLKESGLNILA
ncbi:MAG: flagellar hook-length control protein FliK, partial [Tissierellia bacterium]|nr:flagellar hook-length control protein FliK [Tissierellia bacterium]